MKIESIWSDTSSGTQPIKIKKMTTQSQKPSLFLKGLAVLIAFKGLIFLAGAIYAVIPNLL